MDWYSLAGSAVQSFSNWFTNQHNMSNQLELMDKQHAQNKELARIQQNYLLRNAENASIFERVSREKAGFNLNSEGGFSPLAGMSSPSTGSPSAPQMSPVDVATLLNASSQRKVADAQARNLDADTRNKNDQHDDLISVLQSTAFKNYADAGKANAETLAQTIENSRLPDKLDAEIENIRDQSEKLRSDVKVNDKNIDVQDELIKVYQKQVEQIDSNINLNSAQKRLAVAQAYQAMMTGRYMQKQYLWYDRYMNSFISRNGHSNMLDDMNRLFVKGQIFGLAYELNTEGFVKVVGQMGIPEDEAVWLWNSIHGARWRRDNKYVKPPSDKPKK